MTIRVILDIPATPATPEAVLACLKEGLPTTRPSPGAEALGPLANQITPAKLGAMCQGAARWL